MIGAEKVVTMTSTYDHRIIQGAESGRFLGLIEERLRGEHGFYEQVFEALDVELGPPPLPPLRQPRRPPQGRRTTTEQVPTDDLLACRPRRHDLRHPGAQPRAPRRPPRSARQRARGRPRPRPAGARADAADPGEASRAASSRCTCPERRSRTRCPTSSRPTAARSPTRSSTSPPTASGCGCASTSSPGPSVTS